MDPQGNEGTQNKPIIIDDEGETKKSYVKKTPRVHIDLTAFDEANDPALERELAEIALSSRTNTFSTTSSDHTARDLENGNSRYSRDEADRPSWGKVGYEPSSKRGWRSKIKNMKPINKKKMYLVGILVVIIAAIIGVVCAYLLNYMTDRQVAMDQIISRVTDPNVFKHDHAPQKEAREWLLFKDTEHYDLDEGRVIQRYVLAVFYFATGSEAVWELTNWLSGNECAEGKHWYGLDCNSNGRVRTLFQGETCVARNGISILTRVL